MIVDVNFRDTRSFSYEEPNPNSVAKVYLEANSCCAVDQSCWL